MRLKHLIAHESKRHTLLRFLWTFLINVGYTLFLYYKFGGDGFYLGALTWSFFVLCTPIPDGGLLLDFPIRLMTGLRMVYSEIIVWIVAISFNIYILITNPGIYDKTVITAAFKQILTKPWPNWIIILISCAGTFLGLYFADELLDIIKLKDRIKFFKHKRIYDGILMAFLIVALYYFYRYFLQLFGINI